MTNAPRRRMMRRWIGVAAGLVAGTMLAGASLTPASAKEVLLRIGDVHVPSGTIVHGDAIAVGGTTYVDGTVEGDAVAVGGSVDVRGHVTGSVRAMGGNAELRSTAVVEGGVSAAGGKVVREPGASMGGQPPPPPPTFPLPLPGGPGPGETQPAPPWWVPGALAGLLWVLHSLFWAGHLFLLAMFVGTAWLLAVRFPRGVARVGAVLERDPVMALAAGIVTWPAVMVLTVLLALTVVGVPLALSMPAAVIVAAQLGVTAVALILGKRVHPSDPVREIVVGAVLLAIAFSLPGLGQVVGLAAVTLGLGAVVLMLVESRRFRTRPPDPHPPESPQAPGPTAAG